MTRAELEQRIHRLEDDVARLKARAESEESVPWWVRITGTFAHDPIFEEAMRLGRQYRESLRPKPTRKRRRKNGRARH